MRYVRLFTGLILIGAAAISAHAAEENAATPPKAKTYRSSNGRFVARVVPVSPEQIEEKKGKKPELFVYVVHV